MPEQMITLERWQQPQDCPSPQPDPMNFAGAFFTGCTIESNNKLPLVSFTEA